MQLLWIQNYSKSSLRPNVLLMLQSVFATAVLRSMRNPRIATILPPVATFHAGQESDTEDVSDKRFSEDDRISSRMFVKFFLLSEYIAF